MSATVEEIIKNTFKPIKPKKPKKVKEKTNKGKRLRGGKFVYKRPYKMPESIKIKIDQVWYSEKTGKTYSSENQKLANEARSEKMKEYWRKKKQTAEWRLRNVRNKIIKRLNEGRDENLPQLTNIPWEDLDTRGMSHKEGILYEIFYKLQNNDWSELKEGTLVKLVNRFLPEAAQERKEGPNLTGYIEGKDRDMDYMLLNYKFEGGDTIYSFLKNVVGLKPKEISLV